MPDRNDSDSSSLSFSTSSEESDVPEHLGLAPFAWDPTEKLKAANKKLQDLELPKEENSRPGSTIRFNEQVAIKSSSNNSSRSSSPDQISEQSEKSEKSTSSVDS